MPAIVALASPACREEKRAKPREAGASDNRPALVTTDLEDAILDAPLAFGVPVLGRFAIEERLPVLDLHPLGLVVFVLVKPGRGFLVNGQAGVVIAESEQRVLGERLRWFLYLAANGKPKSAARWP